MKILITGSRGFLGGTIGRLAVRLGHVVVGIGRATQPDVNWPGQYVTADVLNADLSTLIHDFTPTAIIHAAGTASVGSSFVAPMQDLQASLLSWANVLESVRRSGRFPLIFYPSSAAVYGEVKNLPVNEDAPLSPISPYGFHKAACEVIAREYATCFDQRIVLLRLFSVFGELQRRLLIWELFRQFSQPQGSVWLEGTGRETRDYLYADDVANAVLRLIAREADESGGFCEVFNLASGIELKVMYVAEQIKTFLQSTKGIHCRGQQRSGDPQRWHADVSKLRQLIGDWTPESFEVGLARCLSAWQQKPSSAQ